MPLQVPDTFRPHAAGPISKSCVTWVTPRIVAETEQYYSSDSLMARSTFLGSRSWPETM